MIEKFIKPVFAQLKEGKTGFGEGPSKGGEGSEIYNPILSDRIKFLNGDTFIALLIKNLITLFLIIAAIATLFMLITGGVRWIVSAGDKNQLENARSQITHALIGLVLVFCSFAIIKIVGGFFGINLLEFDLSPLFLK